MFKRVRALIIKELQTLFGDPQSRVLLFLPVILQTALFPFAVTLDVQNNTLAVLTATQARFPLNSFNALPGPKLLLITSTSRANKI
jgi:hypothetical protein